VCHRSRVTENRLSTQSRRLEALEQEREAGEALRHSQEGMLRDLRDKVAALTRENEALRAQLRGLSDAGTTGVRLPAEVPPADRVCHEPSLVLRDLPRPCSHSVIGPIVSFFRPVCLTGPGRHGRVSVAVATGAGGIRG
jgi:hypothetical protein